MKYLYGIECLVEKVIMIVCICVCARVGTSSFVGFVGKIWTCLNKTMWLLGSGISEEGKNGMISLYFSIISICTVYITFIFFNSVTILHYYTIHETMQTQLHSAIKLNSNSNLLVTVIVAGNLR